MGGWNLWKLTAIAMVLVTATAVVTGLVVAYWSGSAPERGLKQAAVSSPPAPPQAPSRQRSEEHTSELQSRLHLVCRLLLEKKKKRRQTTSHDTTIETTLTHTNR